MLHSHPPDTCSVRSNFKETYLGLVGTVVLGLVGDEQTNSTCLLLIYCIHYIGIIYV